MQEPFVPTLQKRREHAEFFRASARLSATAACYLVYNLVNGAYWRLSPLVFGYYALCAGSLGLCAVVATRSVKDIGTVSAQNYEVCYRRGQTTFLVIAELALAELGLVRQFPGLGIRLAAALTLLGDFYLLWQCYNYAKVAEPAAPLVQPARPRGRHAAAAA